MLAWTLEKSPVPYSISPGRSRILHILGCFNQFQTLLGVGLSWDRLASHTEWEFAHFRWYFWVLFDRVQRRVLRRRVEAEHLRLPFLCIPTNCHRSNHILPEAPEETDPRAKPCSDSPPLAVLVVLENTKGSSSSLSSIFFSSLLFISFCFLYVSDETKSRLWKEKGHSPRRATLTETPGSPFALLSKVLSAFLCCFFYPEEGLLHHSIAIPIQPRCERMSGHRSSLCTVVMEWQPHRCSWELEDEWGACGWGGRAHLTMVLPQRYLHISY